MPTIMRHGGQRRLGWTRFSAITTSPPVPSGTRLTTENLRAETDRAQTHRSAVGYGLPKAREFADDVDYQISANWVPSTNTRSDCPTAWTGDEGGTANNLARACCVGPVWAEPRTFELIALKRLSGRGDVRTRHVALPVRNARCVFALKMYEHRLSALRNSLCVPRMAAPPHSACRQDQGIGFRPQAPAPRPAL